MSNIKPSSNETDQQKVTNLFGFLKELNLLKSKSILNVGKYSWYLMLSDIPVDLENITLSYCDRTDDSEEGDQVESTILTVHKPPLPPCPAPDKILVDWLLPGWDDYKKEAAVKEKIGDSESAVYFNEDPNRVDSFAKWKTVRSEWVEKRKLFEKTRILFDRLYALYFELQRESETEEMIVASGFIRDKSDAEINHPVLTHRVNLQYDASEDTIRIIDTNIPSELYSPIFSGISDINVDCITKFNKELVEKDYHPLDRNDTPIFLKGLIRSLSSDSVFCSPENPVPYRNYRLTMSVSPCFILRKRLDGTVKAIEQIIQNIRDTNEVPEPIREIVSGGKISVSDDSGELSIEEQLASVGGESADILLSKEANKEQLEIARRIERYNAVLVQGPPGTGKTHTIANLMGHFLAQGKSVLVTSHTSKALRVLKDKVAPGLQNLCVSVLDDSNVDMSRSIEGITTYMSSTNSFELKRNMDDLAVKRRDIMDKLADVRRKMFAAIHQECECIVYNGDSISPSKAAEFVTAHSEDLSYIPGRVRKDSPLPLTFDQLSDLYRSNGYISEKDEDELSTDLPNPSSILSPAEFTDITDEIDNSQNLLSEIQTEKNWKVSVSSSEIILSGDLGELNFTLPDKDATADLLEYCRAAEDIEDWMKSAAVDGKNGGAFAGRWNTMIDQIEKTCVYAESLINEQFGIDIQIPDIENLTASQDTLIEIRNILKKKQKLSKLDLLFHKEYNSLLESLTIDGHHPGTKEDCDIILHCVELYQMRKKCASFWNQIFSFESSIKFFDLDSDTPEHVASKLIPTIKKYLDWYKNCYDPLLEKLSAVGFESQTLFGAEPLDNDITATDKILHAVKDTIPEMCEICLKLHTIEECQNKIDNMLDVLSSGKRGMSSICRTLVDAITNRNKSDYSHAFSELESMYEKYDLLTKRKELLNKLESIAPDWASAIRDRSGIHGEVSVPSNIEDAWKWKQLSLIIDEITAHPFSELQEESIRLGREYRESTALFAEKSGWYHLLKRTEADIDMKQALNGWKQTVMRIGKGTGKNAPKLKAKARELMAKCQSAVPSWIMPVGKALESLDPKVNRFDIVIIDEASQADISSLAILYMGKKLIIVGDDKQVSPMAVGVEVDKTNMLEQKYLMDIPNSHLYNGKTSIYDIAATTFQPLMLKEHFRCVPEIIGFSNMLSYDYKIKPLRDAGSSNLLPAVVNYRVDAHNEGGKTNTAEAEAICALIQSCLEQNEYKGKTFGVISLLGDEQVKLIQQLLEQKIDRHDMVDRNILCGNSANFQGDERDVVFLSVVACNNGEGPIRLAGEGADQSTKKRYNVAASRARDQLWVVDSLDPSNDLKPGDLRKTLIDYSLNPQAFEIKQKEVEQRSESPFEEEVASKLIGKGYHIEQQRKIGAYRLDIVAMCGEKAVAIECDGERWHSIESKIREDMERQTILERLGWKFIRIRGSEYYRNREKTLDRVIAELGKLDIFPENSIVTEAQGRETELLHRVKNRAAEIITEWNKLDEAENSSNAQVV